MSKYSREIKEVVIELYNSDYPPKLIKRILKEDYGTDIEIRLLNALICRLKYDGYMNGDKELPPDTKTVTINDLPENAKDDIVKLKEKCNFKWQEIAKYINNKYGKDYSTKAIIDYYHKKLKNK